eukprot:867004-Prorocentrum_minimum.AAC.3
MVILSWMVWLTCVASKLRVLTMEDDSIGDSSERFPISVLNPLPTPSRPPPGPSPVQVLEYFSQLRQTVQADHLIFSFDEKMRLGEGDKALMGQLTAALGFR